MKTNIEVKVPWDFHTCLVVERHVVGTNMMIEYMDPVQVTLTVVGTCWPQCLTAAVTGTGSIQQSNGNSAGAGVGWR